MKKEDNKIDFDLSTLTLQELVEVYQEITDFLEYLKDNKIELEEEKEKEDE